MHIALVSAFPPSRGGLNEYGYHVARELQRDPLLSLTVLADDLPEPQPELDGFEVTRCWGWNRLSNPARLLRALRELKPDVVWFNLLFSSFGGRPAPAFAGLCIPAMTRTLGFYTHVTLHHLMDRVNLGDAGVRHPRLYRLAGSVATRILLRADSVSVLLPAYRRTLIERYRGRNVHFRAHGTFSACPHYPDFSRRGNPEHRILAFGKWGTYKRLELLLQAFQQVTRRVPTARLVIAGADHPKAPGYVARVAAAHAGDPRVEFCGYVPEAEIPELFSTASVMVMPYSSATGSSGVAHQGCEYGLPIVCADIPDFREMASDEDMAIEFFRPGDASDLAAKLTGLLLAPEQQREMAEQNFSAALRTTMPQIIRQYLRNFDLDQRARVLGSVSRFRSLPAWLPRSAMFRGGAARWRAWT